MNRIYHYCSIDTLALILKYKTIRFSRLDKMDDQTEMFGLPNVLIKKYFMSCWVDEAQEKIPQWAMYAPKGVRIEFPEKWYNKFTNVDLNEFTKMDSNNLVYSYGDMPYNAFFPLPISEVLRPDKKFGIVPILNEDFVVKVIYKADFENLKKSTWKKLSHESNIGLNNLSDSIRYKDTYWAFQSEVRFFLFAMCKDDDVEHLPLYIDVPINENIFKNIKIRAYPNCSIGDMVLIESIVKGFLPELNSDEIIESSNLDGKYFPKN